MKTNVSIPDLKQEPQTLNSDDGGIEVKPQFTNSFEKVWRVERGIWSGKQRLLSLHATKRLL